MPKFFPDCKKSFLVLSLELPFHTFFGATFQFGVRFLIAAAGELMQESVRHVLVGNIVEDHIVRRLVHADNSSTRTERVVDQ